MGVQVGRRRVASLVAALSVVAGALSAYVFMVSTPVSAATTSHVAYVFDFGSGINDANGPGSGSSIFRNAVTGGAIGTGGTGTYNGAAYTNVPVSTVDASGVSAFSGFDTVLLYEICDIHSHPNTITAVNAFLNAGGKVMLFDADRCAPGFGGQADYTGLLFPFATNSPGPRGASGSYTQVEASTLTTGLAVGAVPGDAVGDANIFTSSAGGWCESIQAKNVNNTTGFVEAYARTTAGGLMIYEGEDFWFSFGPTPHLKNVFDDMQAQAFNPDGLPCTTPASGIKLDPASATNNVGSSQMETATVINTDGSPDAGVTVTFTVNSGPDAGTTGTATTDASGHATFTYADNTAPGVDHVTARFTDTTGTHTSNESVITWNQQATTVTYTGPLSGDFNDAATVSAVLNDSHGNPIPGQTLVFTLNGTETCAGTTDGTGSASCSIIPGEAAASYPLTATFGGTAKYSGSSATTSFAVTLEETTTTYSGPTLIANGGPVTLSGVLTEDGAIPLPGRTMELALGSGGTQQTCTGVTGVTGAASCMISTVSQPLGPGVVTAAFSGDAFYQPSSDSASTIVYAFAAGGSFAIGDQVDRGVGSSVLFWGAQWQQNNPMSGGSAPNSFKGFEDDPAVPSCGTGWSTDPGNSTPPPATIPSFMAVIVSSSITKSGSSIAGDTVHVVIVQTNPGYGPQPSTPGTGTVVAVVC